MRQQALSCSIRKFLCKRIKVSKASLFFYTWQKAQNILPREAHKNTPMSLRNRKSRSAKASTIP